MIVSDAGYRTPAIAHELLEDGIKPLFPYKRPMTKDGFYRKYEYVYDEYYDCYLCPENYILCYYTTNREGYREYRSCGETCTKCRSLHKCTESKEHRKVVTRHVWEEYIEKAEDIRHTIGNKQIYELRKETIERLFGTAKEQHGFRYTQYKGKAQMEMKAGLTFACMNLKKLARILAQREVKSTLISDIWCETKEKMAFIEKWCWSSSPAPTLSTVWALVEIQVLLLCLDRGGKVYPVSEAFLRVVQENIRRYYWTGEIRTKGGAVYPFGYEDIVKVSGYITAQCCGSTEIELGTVYAAEMGIMFFRR